jgi:flagellar protein FliL
LKTFWFSCVLALALVALVSLGFSPTTGRAESAPEAPQEALPEEELPADAANAKTKKDTEGANGTLYIHLQPMIVPVIGANGAEQLVTLLIDLQVKEPAISSKIRSKMPRVQDSILRALYGGLGDGSLRQGQLVDIAKIKNKIGKAVDTSVGEHVVDEVLIQAVAQRML